MTALNGHIWRFRKVDILFVVGIAAFIYGVYVRDYSIMIIGAGVAGVPLAQRGDKP